MPTVAQIGPAPVKSGSLNSPAEVVGPPGIVGARQFVVLRAGDHCDSHERRLVRWPSVEGRRARTSPGSPRSWRAAR